MSNGARIALGISLFVLAAGFFALVPFMTPVSPQAGPGMAFFGLFCAIGATACLWKGSHPVTIRAVGAIVFATALWYVLSEARQSLARPGVKQIVGESRSSTSLINSLLLMGLVGLPAGYAALKGSYPGWGRHAKAFGHDDRR